MPDTILPVSPLTDKDKADPVGELNRLVQEKYEG